MRLPAAKFIKDELKGILQIIDENEGQINDLPPNEQLYAKKFYDHTDGFEYNLKLKVAENRRYGDMILFIYATNMNIRNPTTRITRNFFIMSPKVRVLHKCLAKILYAAENVSIYKPEEDDKNKEEKEKPKFSILPTSRTY
uniref:Cystatin domain-containing protein n=1 Tax=Acrobeloides nanus TaxID=290746 RepID=A0A914BVN2_9BILA